MHNHPETFGRFPSGGWGFVWTGDPDRGTDRAQPGGWAYSILPFLEHKELRELGKGSDAAEKRTLAAKVAQHPLPVFTCPSRRSVGLYPYSEKHPVRNAIAVSQVAKSDYAANAGDVSGGGQGPATLEEGDSGAYGWGNVEQMTGVLYKRSEVRLSDIVDGATNTYLIGEKRCLTQDPDWGDDQHMFLGHGLDTARYTTRDLPPMKDGPDGPPRGFGSAHTSGCCFLFADGSVRLISYQIDREIHRSQGNRKDGPSPSQ